MVTEYENRERFKKTLIVLLENAYHQELTCISPRINMHH